jgi:hypothetical protein
MLAAIDNEDTKRAAAVDQLPVPFENGPGGWGGSTEVLHVILIRPLTAGDDDFDTFSTFDGHILLAI